MCANTLTKVILSFDFTMCAHTFYGKNDINILLSEYYVCKIILNML